MARGQHGDTRDSAARAVRFSVISAVYNVARFLPAFIESIDKQTFPATELEIIAVDDGSTDDSLAVLKQWQARRPELVRVLTKANGGQGSARNLGIEHATGEWVTFPDPDDLLEPDYFDRVDAFLRTGAPTDLVATNRLMLDEGDGEITDTHPLRRMFAAGDRVVDLTRFPDFFHGSAPSAFFRNSVLSAHTLHFDTQIRPNFEDGHFCIQYLLLGQTQRIAFLGSAHYIYRKRVDASSTLQNSLADTGRYLVVPRRGYLAVLRHGAECNGGRPPEWIQNFVLYELSFYFSGETAVSVSGTAASGDVATAFLETLREIVSLLDPGAINSFGLRRLPQLWRDILLHTLRQDVWVTPYAVIRRLDRDTGQMQLAYRFFGPRPKETILFRGLPITPEHGKIQTHVYFDRVLMYERLVWVPTDGTLRLLLDGRPVEIRPEWPDREITTFRPSWLERWFPVDGSETELKRQLSLADRAVLVLAKSLPVRRRYRNAWVLLDRLHDADDNAERLFEYLREHRQKINAWFVIEKNTPDWTKLAKAGYGRRLVAHGGLRWKLLMLNCAHLISSHADAPVHSPAEILRLAEPKWRFSFLQHGVIKDDISRWLNPKRIDLFVTSTATEHSSIVGDQTPYAFTSKEVKMTGLPRFDRLLALGQQIPPEQRTLILVSPTWRQWLNLPKARGSHRRVVTDNFFDSEYVRMWTAFLRDERLGAAAEKYGCQIGFLPHPNIQPALTHLGLPAHVRPLSFAGNDVQRLFASTTLMVTDYSSTAFNAAYLDRPVIYFQFDAERVLGGGHTGRRGYYDYTRDGFGPVTASVEQAVSAVEQMLSGEGTRLAEYRRRMTATFGERDGLCCERTANAIVAMTRRAKPPTRSLS